MLIFRYLCKEVLTTLLATTLILLIIFITNQFVHYLNDAAGGKITIQAVMEAMTLQVPLFLGYLLPLSLFLGLLLTLGRFYAEHEMVVLSACGVSRTQLVVMVVSLASLVTVVVACLMLVVEPKMQWYQAKIFSHAVATASLDKIIPGRFQRLGSNAGVFYAAKVNDHHMTNVFLARSTILKSGAESWDVVSADRAGEVERTTNGGLILFNGGFRYVGVPGERKYQAIKFATYGIRLISPSKDISQRIEAMTTDQLWHLRKTNLAAAAEWQWRVAMPLSTLVFALLAIPLSQVNPRRGRFAQMLPALLIYIVYANLMFISRAWIEKGVIGRHIGLWWIHILLIFLAFVLLALQKGWRQLLAIVSSKQLIR